MHTKILTQESYEVVYWNDVISAVYLPLFFSYLYHNNLVLDIGRIDNVRYVFVFILLELMKYIFYVNRTKVTLYKQNGSEFLKRLLTFGLIFVSIYIIAILFGAPALSNVQETFMFTLLLTTFTALPLCLYFGSEGAISMLLSITSAENNNIRKLFMLKVRLAILGAWLGATVIPLDWNRPWQNWPVPCCVGTIFGYTLATWVCVILQYNYRNTFDKKAEKYSL